MEVRNYKDSDYESVVGLYKNSELYGGQFDEDRDSRERMRKHMERDPEAVLICENENEVVGTISLIENVRTAWLFRFASTSEESTKKLFEKASEILKSRGHKQVLVYSPSGNDKLDLRYKSLLGFEKGNDYTCFWKEI